MILRDHGWCKFFVTDVPFGHVSADDETLLDRIDVGTDQVCWQEQVHGENCAVQTEARVNEETDAMITETPGLLLIVRTADCGPVLMMDPVKKIVAAIHAGRKGVITGVVEATLSRFKEMGSDVGDLEVFIGPHIRVESYDVGEDVRDEMNGIGKEYLVVERDGKLCFDVTSGIMRVLLDSGVSEDKIGDCEIDTFKSEDYYSYRRHKVETGSSEGYSTFASGIVISK
jgi:polyphenol oxidase